MALKPVKTAATTMRLDATDVSEPSTRNTRNEDSIPDRASEK